MTEEQTGGEGGGGGERESSYSNTKRTCTNRPGLQALCSHIYSRRNGQPHRFQWQDHPFLRYARYKENKSQRYGKEGLDKNPAESERGRGGAGPVDARTE